MAVEAQHPEYKLRAPQWKRCRDAFAGQDAIHAAGAAYLPKLKDQGADEYNSYKMRAGFYNATSRTVSGLIGMLFRKPPKLEVADGIKDDLKDADMKGKPFEMFAQDVAEESLVVGRVGVLVDHAVAPPSNVVVTVAVAREQGLRPMVQMYRAENIINWRVSRINNATVLAMVVLTETYEYPVGEGKPDEPFGPKSTEFSAVCETRYRVLDIDTQHGNTYRQRIYRKNRNDVDQLVETIVPLMDGFPLAYIPFWFIGPDGIDIEVETPPLLDLVNVNIAHYRVTADYEHGCHFTGLPTPWISGYQNPTPEKGEPAFYIGSTKAWVFSDANAKAEYLEFTGQGLTSLEKNLDRKEGHMAVLGARMLAPEKKQTETATTAAIHRTGENSALAGIGIAVSLALTLVLRTFTAWAGQKTPTDKTNFETTRDFMPVNIDAATLTALVKAWQSGAISFETFYDLLQRGDISQADVDAAAEQARIEKNPAPAPAAPAAGGAAPPGDGTNKDAPPAPKAPAAA